MRYGNPALGAELARMKEAGCERILVAPLYPQYSGRDHGDREWMLLALR